MRTIVDPNIEVPNLSSAGRNYSLQPTNHLVVTNQRLHQFIHRSSMTAIFSTPPIQPTQPELRLSFWKKLQSRRINPMKTGTTVRFNQRKSLSSSWDDSTLIMAHGNSAVSSEGNSSDSSDGTLSSVEARRVRFESNDKLETVRYIQPDPTRLERSYNLLEYHRIHSTNRSIIKQCRSEGLTVWLECSLVDREGPTVQASLNNWADKAEQARGLEVATDRGTGYKREKNRSRHSRQVICVQALVNKRPQLNTEEELGRVSEMSSHNSAVFARMMGKADAAAVFAPTDNTVDKNDDMAIE